MNFVPRRTKDEEDLKVIKPTVSAITMEDVVPITVSDASRLAPEEIYERPKKKRKA